MIKSINGTNLLSSIYLLILYTSNLAYDDIIFGTKWKFGSTCFTLYVLDLCFNILLPIYLTLLSFSRLMVVLYPLESKYKEIKFVRK